VTADALGAVRLREMRWWDIPAAMEIELALFPGYAWTEAGFWSELAGVPQTRYFVVAEDSSGLVGYAGLLALDHEADVQTVAVRGDRQGRGLGGRLLDDLLAQARLRDCSQVMLEVRADNAPAQAIYLARGFERISLRRGYYGPGLDAVVMRVRLGGTE
jgi:[ribosomal protein S18]-alanine N-acetyltransferase